MVVCSPVRCEGSVGALALAKVAASQGRHPYLGLLGLLGGACVSMERELSGSLVGRVCR